MRKTWSIKALFMLLEPEEVQMRDKIKVLTVGAGAVGAYFTGRLAQTGKAEVSVVVRSDYDAVKRNGFHIRSECGDFDFVPAGVYRSAEEYPDIPDYIVLSSKVLPQIDGPALIRGAVKSPGTAIVLIQNGIGIEDKIAEAFKENEILSTIAYIGATRSAPGVIRQKGSSELKFGRFGGGDSQAGRLLEELYRGTTVKASFVENIAYHRWVKLLWNLPYNPVSVLGGGLTTKEMSDRGPVEALCRELMEEVRLAASACGIEIPAEMIDKNIEYTRNFPPYKTSMLVDFEAGRQVEAEAILGNVCRLAEKHGLSVPRMKTCYTLLSALDKKHRRKE